MAPAYIKGFAQIKPSDRINVGVIGIKDRGGFYGGQSGTAAFSTGLQQDRSNKPTIILTNEDVEPDPRWDEILKAGIDYHFQNFVDCVKSRKSSDLIADIEEGHISTAMMHLGNIAYHTGRKLVFDGKAENFGNDTEANSYLSRPGGGRKPYNMPDVV